MDWHGTRIGRYSTLRTCQKLVWTSRKNGTEASPSTVVPSNFNLRIWCHHYREFLLNKTWPPSTSL